MILPKQVISNVSNHILDYTLSEGDVGTLFTNTGASATVRLTLPAPSLGLYYEVAVLAAQTLEIKCPGVSVLLLGVSTTTSGGIAFSNFYGSTLSLKALDATTWICIGLTGNWSVS